VSERQDELLAKEDGRYLAIGKIGTSLGSLATTEQLHKKTVVGFGLPSGPALFLHLAHQAFEELQKIDPSALFDSHQQGLWPDDQKPLFDFFEDSIAHIVFAFTAIEAFANEALPDGVTHLRIGKDKKTETLKKADIERRLSLDEKLVNVLPTALSVASPKKLSVWQHYVDLRKTRDRLIHLKSIDRTASGPEEQTIWGKLLRAHDRPWCDYAHELIGHFAPAVDGRRWYGLYPYPGDDPGP
jgi:hypothetical protein